MFICAKIARALLLYVRTDFSVQTNVGENHPQVEFSKNPVTLFWSYAENFIKTSRKVLEIVRIDKESNNSL